ncbi:hypothetical protein JCM16303_004224 [Sporobolomyces ruberrimus]
MLRLGGSTACRCTSTSTSLPCRHAATRRSYSRKTPPNSAPAPAPQQSASSYSYKPAIPHSVITGSGKDRWFEPVPNRSGWKDWILHDQRHSRSSIPPPSPPPLSDQDTTTLLNAYLTNRGPRTSLHQFSDEYGQLLEIAKKQDMPFLKAMVLEDLELSEMSNGERQRLRLDRFEKGKKVKVVGDPIEARGLVELVRGIERSEIKGENSTKLRKKEETVTSAVVEDKVQVIAKDEPVTTLSQALSILTHFAHPSSTSSINASSLSHSQLSETWELFSPAADLENSIQDYTLTLSFLHHLVSTSLSSEDFLPLALKVFGKLVETLPEELIASQPTQPSIPSDISLRFVLLRTLANAATSEDLYSISSKALHSLDKLHSLLPSSDQLDPFSTELRQPDLELLHQTITGWSSELREERIESYKPSKLDSSKQGSSLDELARLFDLLHSWTPSISHRQTPKEQLDGFVEECAERYRWDLVARVFKKWNETGTESEGYSLQKYHLKFARWLAGEAPYSTYSLPPPSSRSSETFTSNPSRSPRLSDPSLFSLFARLTHIQLRSTPNSPSNLSTTWSTTQKYEYLDLLTTSSGSTSETRSLARRIVSYWTQTNPLLGGSNRDPFVLRGSTLLNLIRTSLPPYSSNRPTQEQLGFLRSLVNQLIQALVLPNSPYSTTRTSSTKGGGGGGGSGGPELNHYDLTTLAQCYTLLGDGQSVGQVYRKMLDMKFLPDRKDVELVLGASTSLGGEGVGLERVRQARKVGVKVGEKVVQGLLKGVLEREVEERRALSGKELKGRDQWKKRVEEIMVFAKEELEFGEKEMERIEEYVLGYLPLCEIAKVAKLPTRRLLSILSHSSNSSSTRDTRGGGRSALPTISMKLALGLVQKASGIRHYLFACRVYQVVLSSSQLPAPQLLTLTLETLLKAHSNGSSKSKPKILDSLKTIIDETLESSPLTVQHLFFSNRKENKTLKLVLRGLIKVGELEALEMFWGVMEGIEEGVNVEKGTKEMVVRWAVGMEGREEVKARDGVVGDWAREVLRKD